MIEEIIFKALNSKFNKMSEIEYEAISKNINKAIQDKLSTIQLQDISNIFTTEQNISDVDIIIFLIYVIYCNKKQHKDTLKSVYNDLYNSYLSGIITVSDISNAFKNANKDSKGDLIWKNFKL